MIEEHLATDGIVVAATHVPLGLKSCRELRLERQAVAE
jgi:ABC-type transport system involved in cytochrome c biogenesis ATPase subunit